MMKCESSCLNNSMTGKLPRSNMRESASRSIGVRPSASGSVLMPLVHALSTRTMPRQLFDTTTIQTHLAVLADNQQRVDVYAIIGLRNNWRVAG